MRSRIRRTHRRDACEEWEPRCGITARETSSPRYDRKRRARTSPRSVSAARRTCQASSRAPGSGTGTSRPAGDRRKNDPIIAHLTPRLPARLLRAPLLVLHAEIAYGEVSRRRSQRGVDRLEARWQRIVEGDELAWRRSDHHEIHEDEGADGNARSAQPQRPAERTNAVMERLILNLPMLGPYRRQGGSSTHTDTHREGFRPGRLVGQRCFTITVPPCGLPPSRTGMRGALGRVMRNATAIVAAPSRRIGLLVMATALVGCFGIDWSYAKGYGSGAGGLGGDGGFGSSEPGGDVGGSAGAPAGSGNGSDANSGSATPGTSSGTSEAPECSTDGDCGGSDGCLNRACRDGTCEETLAPAGASCADGNACNGAETCSGGGDCLSGEPVDVDDHNACTTDTCDPATGSVSHPPHFFQGWACSNGRPCSCCAGPNIGHTCCWPDDWACGFQPCSMVCAGS